MPFDLEKIANALLEIHGRLQTARGAVSVDKRKANINTVKGNIQDAFQIVRDTSAYTISISAVTDLRASLLRATSEGSRFEMKQGIHSLESARKLNKNLLTKITEMCCAIANSNPDDGGIILFGVTGKESDARSVARITKQEPSQIGRFSVVRVDHEIGKSEEQCKTVDDYMAEIVSAIHKSELSIRLKTEILNGIESSAFEDRTIVKLSIPPQNELAIVGEEVFYREGSRTMKVTARKASELQRAFQKRR